MSSTSRVSNTESSVTSNGKTVNSDGRWDLFYLLRLRSTKGLIEVLGKPELEYAFDEYVKMHPSFDTIRADHIYPRIFAMLSWPEPTFLSLLNSAREPPTDEPWAEALFCWRVKRHLESRECTAVDWTAVDYYALPSVEDRRSARATNLERYKLILALLERLQEDRSLAGK
ncbi:hypothetical protein F4819DRAFT_135966 [Hypoxylon fuscum]|nr:hypothetical protein F4819DRAFT_135966 [Hypoxylon fuscum]